MAIVLKIAKYEYVFGSEIFRPKLRRHLRDSGTLRLINFCTWFPINACVFLVILFTRPCFYLRILYWLTHMFVLSNFELGDINLIHIFFVPLIDYRIKHEGFQ